ncbi:hypothetical protein [Streptomyces sp. NPDC000851]
MPRAGPEHTHGAAAPLDLVVRVGRLLRRPDQVARSLTRTPKFAGNCSWKTMRAWWSRPHTMRICASWPAN